MADKETVDVGKAFSPASFGQVAELAMYVTLLGRSIKSMLDRQAAEGSVAAETEALDLIDLLSDIERFVAKLVAKD